MNAVQLVGLIRTGLTQCAHFRHNNHIHTVPAAYLGETFKTFPDTCTAVCRFLVGPET